jgi:hypothetical protein
MNRYGERRVGEKECVKLINERPIVQRARYLRTLFFNAQSFIQKLLRRNLLKSFVDDIRDRLVEQDLHYQGS